MKKVPTFVRPNLWVRTTPLWRQERFDSISISMLKFVLLALLKNLFAVFCNIHIAKLSIFAATYCN